ncbi:MAG: hypothetical protein O7G88_13710 [bacterium]|nr:hypothetical protein [bacterium]
MLPLLSLLRIGLGLLLGIVVLFVGAPWTFTGNLSAQVAALPRPHADDYAAQVPKTVIQLQQWRRLQSIDIKATDGKKGRATLINLNPTTNSWYLLRLNWRGGHTSDYHLENGDPYRRRLVLDAKYPQGLVIAEGKRTSVCELWASTPRHRLAAAEQLRLPYAPLCHAKLYLRNRVKGHRTSLESTTDFLRDKIWGGEKLVGLVRDVFFKDAYLDKAVITPATKELYHKKIAHRPRPALLDPKFADRAVVAAKLGIHTQQSAKHGIVLGRWYAAQDNPGVYISTLQPNVIAPQIFQHHTTVAKRLDKVEATALVYLVAFDLGQFDLGFALGTEHPRVGWSARVRHHKGLNKALPGPDGIGNLAPLVATGIINPQYVSRTVATFTAGFKRTHGAFRYGDLALNNHGSHYGFIEHGVVFSKLQPGLATIFVRHDGSVRMKTWTERDNQYLAKIQHARQNGVAIVEFDSETQKPVPGPLVSQWGDGNWSGSVAKKLRTLRAGICVQESRAGRFLIYGYFSSATPSAMARVFQAYGCRYAMHLDMNALEHTYLAVYRRQGDKVVIQHLIQGMSVLDKSEGAQYIPRFVGYADNRDFFYLMRREYRKATP